jgi:hypothetical protein
MNYDSLTKEELKTTNGCGSSAWFAWPFRIPKWLAPWFYLPCCRHDLRYSGKAAYKIIDIYPHCKAEKQYTIQTIRKVMADDELYNAWYFAIYHDAPQWMKGILCRLADFGYWCLKTKVSQWCYNKA